MISTLMARSKLRQILGLMEDERNALIYGPLSVLTEITTKRGEILASMENGGPVSRSVLGNGLAQIRKLAGRNKKLFEASIDGMKAASDTLQQIEKNIGAMETYTSKGQKVRVPQAKSEKDHRV